MPRTFEQEMLEIESARIFSDLEYQKELSRLQNKCLFSKTDIEYERKKFLWYAVAGFVAGMFFWWIISKIN